jgi:hypothetical protein
MEELPDGSSSFFILKWQCKQYNHVNYRNLLAMRSSYNNMHNAFVATFSLSLLIASCQKSMDQAAIPDDESQGKQAANTEVRARKGGGGTTATFTTYTIQQGNHSCDQSTIKSVRTSEMKFAVKFDNSAIYTTVDPNNQYDINKLYGFSEGYNNQYNSARIGWNWYNNALHLHAYVYAKGVRTYQEIKTVSIGAEINCSIKVSGNSYLFTVDGTQLTMPRGATTSTASGYQQYPYFGGDEVAPQKITIQIRNL